MNDGFLIPIFIDVVSEVFLINKANSGSFLYFLIVKLRPWAMEGRGKPFAINKHIKIGQIENDFISKVRGPLRICKFIALLF